MSATSLNGGGTGMTGWIWGPYSRLGLAVATATFVVDQANKWWMLDVYGLPARGRVMVTSFLDVVYVKNVGISYSLLNQNSFGGQLLLAGFGVLASCALWVWLARGGNRLMALSLGLIIGGALGNALDRLRLGGVADFYSLHAFGFYWYIFNIADVAIVAGVIGLLYDSLRTSRNDAAKPL
jgi:signal peptidase II